MTWRLPTAHRVSKPLAIGIIALTASGSLLAAHDFWIIPMNFSVESGGSLELRGQTGSSFPLSMSAVTPDRVAEARLIGASGEERLTDLTVSGKSLMLRHRPSARGQRVVAVSLASRTARTTPDRLKRYIALEGAPALAERYEREGAYPKTDSVTQTSAKFAKSVLEVGRGGPRAFDKIAGHLLELVPQVDPATLHAGGTLPVLLLYRGKPVAGAHLHAGVARVAVGDAPVRAAESAPAAPVAANEPRDISLETDANGIARVPVNEAGIWNVRTLHGAPAPGSSGGTWEVYFATLVFNVGAGSQQEGAAAAVAAVVERYHAALSSGDSATALALLAPDAIILESGGVETRDEYRGHHLPGDIAFARAVPSVRVAPRVVLQGDVAWAWSTSTTRGEYRGRTLNSAGAELMVLSRQADGRWLIRSIHWSSRNRPAGSS